MKMSIEHVVDIEAAMEIWRAGGGVAAAEWQEKTPGWSRRGPIYRRRPTPPFCLEYERQSIEDLAAYERSSGHSPYWSTILTNVRRRVPKARRIIAVHSAADLCSWCEDAKIPAPQRNVDGSWKIGGVVATAEVWMAESERKERRFTEAFGPKPAPRYVWQDLAKRLVSVA